MCKTNQEKHGPPSSVQALVHALHCPSRWKIIEFLGEGKRGTREIYHHLLETGERLTPSGLYYHLSALAKAGIIELDEYREKGGGAPEKIWRLRTTTLTIDLIRK
jgi:DNA-binding transcriptional ArsR family regulator